MVTETSAAIPFETYQVTFGLPYVIWIPDDKYDVFLGKKHYRIQTQVLLRDQSEILGPDIQLPGLVPLSDHMGLAGITRVSVEFPHEGRQSIDEIIHLAASSVARLVQVCRWISDRYYLRPLTRAEVSHFKILYLDKNGKPINTGTVVGPPGKYGPPPYITPEQVKNLRAALLANTSPNLEYQLLHEAARALYFGDYRWTAYNAIGALDVAVSHSFLQEFALEEGVSKNKWKGVVNDLTKPRIRTVLTPLLFADTPIPEENNLIKLLDARHQAIHKGVDVPRELARDGFEAMKHYLDKINAIGKSRDRTAS